MILRPAYPSLQPFGRIVPSASIKLFPCPIDGPTLVFSVGDPAATPILFQYGCFTREAPFFAALSAPKDSFLRHQPLQKTPFSRAAGVGVGVGTLRHFLGKCVHLGPLKKTPFQDGL